MKDKNINLTKDEEMLLKLMHKATKVRKKADRIKTILFLNR
jgi:hypothetical protein